MVYNQVMRELSEDAAVQTAKGLLCAWLNCESLPERNKPRVRENRLRNYVVDPFIYIKDITFFIQYKKSGDVGSVRDGIRRLSNIKEVDDRNIVKTLVVPYMHELGRKYCREAKISWLDLSGNADITGPGIRILIEDQPNLYKRPGRSSSIFAPKSSRVARLLLYKHQEVFSQREIAEQTGLGEGYVSKIIKTMENLDLIDRDVSGRVASQDPTALLDAWLEKYDFAKHNPISGFIPARSGPGLLQHIRDSLSKEGIDYAITGSGAAWLYTHFAAFRTVTVFIDDGFNSALLSKLDFSESGAGANTMIAKPNDPSILWSTEEIDGIRCVHPIQAFLDLKGQPERAPEAMPELKKYIFGTYFK